MATKPGAKDTENCQPVRNFDKKVTEGTVETLRSIKKTKAAIIRAPNGALPDVVHRIYEGVIYLQMLFLFSLQTPQSNLINVNKKTTAFP